ncbi:hypothetical protein ES705_27262 [subsurface metagenome]
MPERDLGDSLVLWWPGVIGYQYGLVMQQYLLLLLGTLVFSGHH